MLDVLRRYVDSLAGITEMPRERAEKLVAELQKRGEVRARDLQRATQEIVDRSLRNRKELVRLVRKEIQAQVGSLGLARREELERLTKRVNQLEGKKKTTAKRKTTPAKKPAKKKAPARKKATGGKSSGTSRGS